MDITQQKKKNPNDPDYGQLNPDIIALAHTNGWVRQSIILYLEGHITWIEALETMVLSVHKEFKLQQKLLNVVIQEQQVPHDLLVAYAKRNHRALPPPTETPRDQTSTDSPLPSGGA